MKLTHQAGVFALESTFADRDVPKRAGFYWHGGNCRPGCKACAAGLGKVWWTPWAEKAQALIAVADPSARAVLGAREASIEASRATDAQVDAPVPEGLAYLPYQRAGIAYARSRPATLIADEMGLGKTIQAIGVINSDPSCKRVLVVCPATLRLNWKRELQKWLVLPRTIGVVETAGEVNSHEIVVVNYDKLVGKRGAPMMAALMAVDWDLLVADEAHYAKNPKAQRTVAVLGKAARKGEPAVPGLVSKARRRVFLTGTPILNRPVEIQPLLAALAPSEFGNFFGFAKRYCGAKQEYVPGAGMVWNFDGATNLDELQNRLRASCMIRRLKKDVLAELPAKRRQIIVLEPNGTAKAVAKEAKAVAAREDRLLDLQARMELAHAAGDEEAYKAAVRELQEASVVAFTEISAARHEVALAKLPHVVEHLEGLFEEGVAKVIVFAHHHDVIDGIAAAFGDAAVVVNGETAMADRQARVDRFQTDPSCRLFVGGIQAAGVGITLTAASVVVFAELSWVPAEITQAEDRAHRIGQKDTVVVQHLVVDGSLDARMAATLVEKQEIADKALDVTPEPLVPISFSVLSERKPEDRRPSKYPVATEEQRVIALSVVQSLAGMCDGARSKDGSGFNKLDARIGHSLAVQERLSDGQVWLVARMARTYWRQLSEGAVKVLNPSWEPKRK